MLRALAIVDALATHPGGATPKTLSADLGLHLSTTYHLLNTLVAAGYASRGAESRLFHLGPRIPYLQHQFQRGLIPDPAVMPLLTALQQATGESVYLVRLLGDDALVLAKLVGGRPDAVQGGFVGYTAPAHLTAVGLVLLAWGTPAWIAEYLKRATLAPEPPIKSSTAAQIRQRLERTRADGYALDPGIMSTGAIGCVAAPIYGPDHTVDTAVSVVVPLTRYYEHKTRLINAVVSVANAASEILVAGAHDGDGAPAERSLTQIEIDDAWKLVWTTSKVRTSKSRTVRLPEFPAPIVHATDERRR